MAEQEKPNVKIPSKPFIDHAGHNALWKSLKDAAVDHMNEAINEKADDAGMKKAGNRSLVEKAFYVLREYIKIKSIYNLSLSISESKEALLDNIKFAAGYIPPKGKTLTIAKSVIKNLVLDFAASAETITAKFNKNNGLKLQYPFPKISERGNNAGAYEALGNKITADPLNKMLIEAIWASMDNIVVAQGSIAIGGSPSLSRQLWKDGAKGSESLAGELYPKIRAALLTYDNKSQAHFLTWVTTALQFAGNHLGVVAATNEKRDGQFINQSDLPPDEKDGNNTAETFSREDDPAKIIEERDYRESLREKLSKGLALLTDNERAALLLRRDSDLTFKEMGERLGFTREGFMVMQKRGIKKIQELFPNDGAHDSGQRR